LGLLALSLHVEKANSQLNPFSAASRAVSTVLDVRTKDEVKADVGIASGASKRLLDDKKSEWTGVTVLVFQRHVVLAGAVKSADVKKRVEEVVRRDKSIRSFASELLVGDVGSLVRDSALEGEINAALTAAKGIASVNMRWCATGGQVVLMGVARSQQEADAALAKIRATKGVKSVKSHLRVLQPKK
jgi:osmotically-inducible protein OsmY